MGDYTLVATYNASGSFAGSADSSKQLTVTKANLIIAGDALNIGSAVDFRAQIVVVKKYLKLLSGLTRVIFCSGNHDLDERSPEGEKISRWIGDTSRSVAWLMSRGRPVRPPPGPAQG